MIPRIIGVEAQFKTYAFFFGVHLGYLILKHTDSLSQALQSPKLSASEGQRITYYQNIGNNKKLN